MIRVNQSGKGAEPRAPRPRHQSLDGIAAAGDVRVNQSGRRTKPRAPRPRHQSLDGIAAAGDVRVNQSGRGWRGLGARGFDTMIIDVHLHFLSPHAIDAARATPDRLGVRALDRERPRLAVGPEPPTRPLLESLYTLPHHMAFLEAQGIDAAVFGPLIDVAGYSLPPAQRAAWSRAQNEGLAASLAAAGGHHVGP